MMRNVLGAALALIAAVAALVSPFRDWYADRAGQDIPLGDLFSRDGLVSGDAGLLTGMFLPMLGAAVLVVAGVLLGSRLLVALAGVVALGFTILWMVRQYQVADSLVIGADGMSDGAIGALAAGVLLLIASTVMTGRRLVMRARTVPVDDRSGPARRDDTVVSGPWDDGTGGSWEDAERRERHGGGRYGPQEPHDRPGHYGPDDRRGRDAA